VGQPVTIKGVRDGLLISFNGDSDADVLHRLNDELTQKQGFLQGSRVAVDLGRRAWEQAQLLSLQTLISEHALTLWAVLSDAEATRTAARALGLATRLPGSHTDLEGNLLHAQPGTAGKVSADSSAQPPPARRENDQPAHTAANNHRDDHAPPPAELANALFLQETLRSGRSVYYPGHIVLMGDVNPGGQIIAGGHVIVWGRLRGMVHAGAHGDESAMICALELSPTQLRIAGQIAVPPDDGRRQPNPEQATIRDGQIVAEAWPVRH
jgi:septum site-determining protein MinC